MRRTWVFVACVALAGCGQSLATDETQAQLVYGIAKGVAQQAVAADPALAGTVAKVEAAADPLVAAATDAPTLASLAQNLLVATAPAVKVVPGTPAGAATSPLPATPAP